MDETCKHGRGAAELSSSGCGSRAGSEDVQHCAGGVARAVLLYRQCGSEVLGRIAGVGGPS
ncbi:MAG: hypothetical protein ACXVXL_23780 [Solirubrobacteraceae bacterium]